MSGFAWVEIEYLQEGPLATVDGSGRPHMVPVGFRSNPELGEVDVRGRAMGQTKKFRDVERMGRVAFEVDDVQPPWRARGVEVRARAEALEGLIRIFPERIVGCGINPDAPSPNARSVAGFVSG